AGGATLSRPDRFAESPANPGRNAWRGGALQPGAAVGRLLEQALLDHPGTCAIASRSEVRPPGARRAQGRRFLFPQAWRRMLRRPLDRDPPGALRRSRDGLGAAAGEEILVAGAAEGRRWREPLPHLQPVRAHLLALGRDQPRDPRRTRTTAADAADVRA